MSSFANVSKKFQSCSWHLLAGGVDGPEVEVLTAPRKGRGQEWVNLGFVSNGQSCPKGTKVGRGKTALDLWVPTLKAAGKEEARFFLDPVKMRAENPVEKKVFAQMAVAHGPKSRRLNCMCLVYVCVMCVCSVFAFYMKCMLLDCNLC